MLFKRIDACCKEHDTCPFSIEPWAEQEGIVNDSIFTLSSCDCDKDFFTCLDNIKGRTANAIKFGFTFFVSQCIDHDYKKVCVKNTPLIGCSKYEYDPTQPKTKVFQKLDNFHHV